MKSKILIVNDDGIEAPGIKVLARTLACNADEFEVIVSAPDKDQSGRSHSITVHEVLQATLHTFHVDDDLDDLNRGVLKQTVRAVRHSGTPVDSVRVAEIIFDDFIPDLVLSGINRGNNAGRNVFYSGTVAAAREGFLHGVTSLATSLDFPSSYPSRHDHWNYDLAAQITMDIVREELKRMREEEEASVRCLSLNVPNVKEAAELKPLVRNAKIGNSGFIGHLRRVYGAHGEATGATANLSAHGRFHIVDAAGDDSIDCIAITHNHPTISVIHEANLNVVVDASLTQPHAMYEYGKWNNTDEKNK